MVIKVSVRFTFILRNWFAEVLGRTIAAHLLLLLVGAVLLGLFRHSLLLLLLPHSLARLADRSVELAYDLVLSFQVRIAGLLLPKHFLHVVHLVCRILYTFCDLGGSSEPPG